MIVNTLIYPGIAKVLQIQYEGVSYYIGKRATKATVDKGTGPFTCSRFDELPYEVQKEYLLWRLSR